MKRVSPTAALADPLRTEPWLQVAGAAVVAVAATVLLGGWVLGNEWLVRLRLSYVGMVPSTALCFLLTAGGLLLARRVPSTALRAALLGTIGLAVAAIGALDVVVIAFDLAPGVDSLLWPSIERRARGDRMALATALCFLLAAYCTLHLAVSARGRHDYVACATVGLVASGVALVGYAFDAEALYGVFIFSAMALHTAVAFALLFTALLLARPEAGWVGLLTRRGNGSAGARRLFPVILAGPILLCLLALKVTDAGYFDASFRLSLLAIVMVAISAGAVLRNAAIENEAERRLVATMRELQVTLDDKNLLLREVYHRVKNNLQQINALIGIESSEIDNPRAREAFETMAGRVQALGVVHQLLIADPSPSQISVAAFLQKLCASIVASHGLARRGIAIEVRAPDERVHLDVAVSLGLLINELVTNAIKHAFPDRQGGTIRIGYGKAANGEIVLTVADDGRGASAEDAKQGPASGDLATDGATDTGGGKQAFAGEGSGALIVRSLVAQLDGDLTVEGGRGTTVTITMPGNISERRRYV